MKKVLSFLLTVCMLTALCVPATYAADTAELTEGELVYVGDGSEKTIPLSTLQEMGGDVELYAVPTGRRIYSEGITVQAIVYINNELRVTTTGYRFAGSTYATYTQATLSKASQNAIFNSVAGLEGCMIVGWYITGSIYMEVYRPGMFQYTVRDHEGTSGQKAKSAVNGSNVFEFATLFPENISVDYTYGMKGTVNYTYKYGLEYLDGQHAVELSVCFAAK